jgi:hypothetical protein
MKEYLALHPEIHVEFLPAYAPEVNPEEFCPGNVKRPSRMQFSNPNRRFARN